MLQAAGSEGDGVLQAMMEDMKEREDEITRKNRSAIHLTLTLVYHFIRDGPSIQPVVYPVSNQILLSVSNHPVMWGALYLSR